MRLSASRRGAGNNPLRAGHLGGDDGHMRRRNHRIAPARDVTSHAVHGNVAVAEAYTGQRLDFDVFQRGLLVFGEIPDLRLCKFDVFDGSRRNGSKQRIDLGLRQAKTYG